MVQIKNLQIKTIRYRLDNAEAFDEAVNDAIREGWRLTKREVLMPVTQPNHYTYIMLYAELEKDGTAPHVPHFRDDRGVSG